MRPTIATRKAVYQRDGYRCAACHTTDELTFQHRRAVGMGGSKLLPPPVDGLTLCLACNGACEAGLQTVALAYGWKVRRWADPERVPVFYPHEFGWFRLDRVSRVRVSGPVAVEMMSAVYGAEWLAWYREAKS